MFQRLLATALVLALSSLAPAQPLTTAFTFQGDLKNSVTPATGTYELIFSLYDAASAGSQLGPTLCSDNIAVAQGLFTTQLDFGAQFSGQQRFLEIAVRADTGINCSNSTGFTTLAPRQPLSASPNAIYSLNAASATTAATAANASQLNGQSASFYTNAANLTGTLPAADLSGTYKRSAQPQQRLQHLPRLLQRQRRLTSPASPTPPSPALPLLSSSRRPLQAQTSPATSTSPALAPLVPPSPSPRPTRTCPSSSAATPASATMAQTATRSASAVPPATPP